MTQRFRGSIVLLACALALVPAVRLAAQGASLENRLKAAVVSKLPQFVQWPAGALEGAATASVCVAPPDPFGRDLVDLIAGNTLDGRPLTVMPVAREQDLARCQVLYVGARSPQGVPLLKAAVARPILTIGDDAHFLDQGGIVQLRMLDGRVRFEINAAAASKVGLRMSSQLLQLAVAVRGEGA